MCAATFFTAFHPRRGSSATTRGFCDTSSATPFPQATTRSGSRAVFLRSETATFRAPVTAALTVALGSSTATSPLADACDKTHGHQA